MNRTLFKESENKKRNNTRNSRIYPNTQLSETIQSIALQSAIDSSVTNDESTIIDNRDSNLERLVPKGPTPEHISFLSGEPARRGDIIQVNKDNKYIIFIYWKNGESRVDLDTSFVGYGQNFEFTDQVCSYYQLNGFRNTVFHSGDITDAPNGAAEFITFNLKELKNANPDVYSIIAITQSFNNISYEKMKDAIVGIGYYDDNNKGDGPDGCVVLSACRLTGKSTTNISAILHLSHEEGVPDSFEFICINAHNNAGVHSAYSSKNMLQEIVINYTLWRNSLNAPITQLEKEVIRASAFNKISFIDKDGNTHIFIKEEQESSIDFHSRLVSLIIRK